MNPLLKKGECIGEGFDPSPKNSDLNYPALKDRVSGDLMKEWSFKKSLFFLVGSTLATFSLSVGGYFGWQKYKQTRIQNEKYHIVSIVQTGAEKQALTTAYLAELLGLSADCPLSLYALDCKAAEKKLLASPLIQSASVKRLPPNAIYIDYEVRKPIAVLTDYKNVAVDRQGFLFPFSPFFSPKEIPQIYLGLPPFEAPPDSMGRKGGKWGVPLKNPFLKIAFEVLGVLDASPWKEGFRIKKIDVSNALHPSLGQREIVLFTEEERSCFQNGKEIALIFPKILRLSPREISEELSHFFLLRRRMEEDYRKQLGQVAVSTRFAPRIIDLRIPQIAFIENQSSSNRVE